MLRGDGQRVQGFLGRGQKRSMIGCDNGHTHLCTYTKTDELYTSKGQTIWYVNFISIDPLRKKNQPLRAGVEGGRVWSRGITEFHHPSLLWPGDPWGWGCRVKAEPAPVQVLGQGSRIDTRGYPLGFGFLIPRIWAPCSTELYLFHLCTDSQNREHAWHTVGAQYEHAK